MVLLFAAAPANAETDATVDLTQPRQVVDALGVNANVHSWEGGELRPAIDEIGAMGATTWRVIIDRADWETTNDNADPASFDWDYYRQIYERGKMADLWNTIAAIEARPGQRVMISAMGGVPRWMGGSRIDTGEEDEWVEMIASLVYYGVRTKGLSIDLLSPMNEPDWDGNEGPQVGAEQYVRLLHKLATRLDALGLESVKFVGPDTAQASAAAAYYYPAMARDALVMARTEAIGIHNYSGTVGGIGGVIANSAFSSTPFWLTEFSTWCGGCDSGAPNPGDWAFARGNVEQLLAYLDAGAAGAQVYDAWDGFYEHHNAVGYWGLLAYDEADGTYSPRKSYHALRQVYASVPPGARLVASWRHRRQPGRDPGLPRRRFRPRHDRAGEQRLGERGRLGHDRRERGRAHARFPLHVGPGELRARRGRRGRCRRRFRRARRGRQHPDAERDPGLHHTHTHPDAGADAPSDAHAAGAGGAERARRAGSPRRARRAVTARRRAVARQHVDRGPSGLGPRRHGGGVPDACLRHRCRDIPPRLPRRVERCRDARGGPLYGQRR